MRSRFDLLLWILFFAFGALYLSGEALEVAYTTYFPIKALWRSLFASLIGVLLIREIIERRELKKSERSIGFVKEEIAHIFVSLLGYLEPPEDWERRLRTMESSWGDYYDRVFFARSTHLGMIESVLDRYSYLMEPDLRNGLFDLSRLLLRVFPHSTQEKNSMTLCDAASSAAAAVNLAVKIAKRNEIFESAGFVLSHEGGKAPELELMVKKDFKSRDMCATFEKKLMQSIQFKDECLKRSDKEKK